MRIKIELDISADEVPLANELLSTLRLITEHANAPLPVVKNTAELLNDLIQQLGDDSTRATAGSSILRMLMDRSYGPMDKLVAEMADAYQKHVFTPDFAASGRSVVPYLEFLRSLQDGECKGKVRDVLVSKIVPQLAKKRAPNADRKDFFAYAESFAFFASIELMSLEGAMTTMGKLLLKPETRAAAVSMLGKTAEFCADLVLAKCKAEVVATVRKQLEAVVDESYQYDVSFICKALRWQPLARVNGSMSGHAPSTQPPATVLAATSAPALAPAQKQHQEQQQQQQQQQSQQSQQQSQQPKPGAGPSSMPMPMPVPTSGSTSMDHAMPVPVPATAPTAATAASTSGVKMGLSHVSCLTGGHGAQPYYICHDSANNLVVSGGKDGDFSVWDSSGRVTQRVQTPMYICGMDLAPSQGLLYMCAFSQEASTMNLPCLNVYATGQSYSYKVTLAKPECMLMASVQALGSDSFMLAETVGTGGGTQEAVCLYDVHRALDSGSLQPVTSFTEHIDIITCMAGSATNPNICFTGSKDCLIKLWDKRQRNGKSVGTFAAPLMDAGGNLALKAHGDMVTCLDNVDSLLISTGADNTMHFWDLRNLSVSPQGCAPVSMLNVGPTPAVKVRASGCPVPHRAAVSTFGGVSMVDFSNLMAPVISPPCVNFEVTNAWIEIKWVNGQLYTAGSQNIDIFDLV